LALGALAQGSIDLDNSTNANGVAITNAGNYYTGTYGMEVWELSGVTNVPLGINLGPGSGQVAYGDMVAVGFKKEATFTNQTMTIPGAFTLGNLTMPDVTPAGSTVVLALAFWDTSDPSWVDMLNCRSGNPVNPLFPSTADCGVIAFLQPTANPDVSPTPEPPNLTGWTGAIGDLVMTPAIESRYLNFRLQVFISPPSVVSDGARWGFGTPEYLNSGTILNLPDGLYTVAFSPVTGWITPPSQTVLGWAGAAQTLTVTGTYQPGVVSGPFGALQVSISPPGAVSAGAQWQVDGGAWQNSGTVVSNLSAGSHWMAFSTVTGWTTPTGQIVVVSANQTTTAVGTYVAVFNGLNYTTNNGAITITGYTGPGGAVTIPDTINGLPVTSIGEEAFEDCANLTTVTIPSSVASIGDWAFAEEGLRSIYFQGNAPSLGGSYVFSDDNLTVYYLPGSTGWGSTFGSRPAVLWSPQVQTSDGSFGVRTNQFGFNITGNSGLVVVVETSTNLANPTWSPIQTITLAGGSAYFNDAQWKSCPTRFYRLTMP